MSKTSFSFLHDPNFRNDPRCARLIAADGAEGYGILMMLLELLSSTPDNNFPHEIPLIVRSIGFPADQIEGPILRMIRFGLLVVHDGNLYSPDILADRANAEEKSNAKSKAARARWDAIQALKQPKQPSEGASSLHMQEKCTSESVHMQEGMHAGKEGKEGSIGKAGKEGLVGLVGKEGAAPPKVPAEYQARLPISDTEYDALLMNHWHGDEAKLHADIAAAHDHLAHKGDTSCDGQAYMRGWLRKGVEFQYSGKGGARGSGTGPSPPRQSQNVINANETVRLMEEAAKEHQKWTKTKP